MAKGVHRDGEEKVSEHSLWARHGLLGLGWNWTLNVTNCFLLDRYDWNQEKVVLLRPRYSGRR